MKSLKTILLAATSLAAGMTLNAPIVFAQESQTGQARIGLEEIVVTARKREESLQSIPISVTAFSADKLFAINATDLTQITRFTPGLSFEQSAFNTSFRFLPQVRFRGMSTNAPQPNSQVGAVFVDGVFIVGGAQSISTDDVERVEILKGPQNTYFGRNTFGGAINFVTRTPGNEFGGEVKAKIETKKSYNFSGSIEGPIVRDVLAARLIANKWREGAHYKSGDGGDLGRQETESLTAALSFTPGENFRLKLRGHYQRDSDFGNPNYPLRTQADINNCRPALLNWWCGSLPKVGDTITNLAGQSRNIQPQGIWQDTVISPSQLVALGRGNAIVDFVNNVNGNMNDIPFYGKLPKIDHFGAEREIRRINASWSWDFLDGYSFAGNAGYGQMRFAGLTDGDQFLNVLPGPGARTYTYIPTLTSDYSAEARITSPQEKRLRWLVGVSGFKQKLDGSIASAVKTVNAATGVVNTNPWQNSDRDRSDVIGVFGAVSYDILPTLTIDAEGRYQVDKLKAFQQTAPNTFLPIFRSFKDFLPRVILSYKPTDETNVYASWSRGALPGLANATFENLINQIAAFPGNPIGSTDKEVIRAQLSGLVGLDVPLTLDSELIDQFELGWKQQFWGGRAFTQIAGYYIDWKNQKQPATATLPNARLPNGRVIPANGDLNGDGIPDGIVVRVAGQSRIYGLEFDAGIQPIEQLTLTVSGEIVNSKYKGFFPGGALVTNFSGSPDLSGKKLFMYPLAKLAFTARWEDTLVGDWNYYLQSTATYNGKNYADEANLSWVKPYWLVNVAFGVERDGILVEAYVNNVTDYDGWLSGRRNSAPDNTQTIALVPARKQTFGLRTRLAF